MFRERIRVTSSLISGILFLGFLSADAETTTSANKEICQGEVTIGATLWINTANEYCKCVGKNPVTGFITTRIDQASTDASCGGAGEICAMSQIRIPRMVSDSDIPNYIADYLDENLNNNKKPAETCHKDLACDLSPEECCVPKQIREFVEVGVGVQSDGRRGQRISFKRQFQCRCEPTPLSP